MATDKTPSFIRLNNDKNNRPTLIDNKIRTNTSIQLWQNTIIRTIIEKNESSSIQQKKIPNKLVYRKTTRG